MNSIIIRILMVTIFISMLSSKSTAETVYKPEVLFTIPWGGNPGELSLFWKTPAPPDFEGLWEFQPFPGTISESGGFVIVDALDIDVRRLTKYSNDGQFIAQDHFESMDLLMPQYIAVSNDGSLILGRRDNLNVLAPDFSVQYEVSVSYDNTTSRMRVNALWPSNSGGFWCVYEISYGQSRDIYQSEITTYGAVISSALLCSGSRDECSPYDYYYVSPDGQVFHYPHSYDQYGNKYVVSWSEALGDVLHKYSPSGDLIYYIAINDAPGWEHNTSFYVMWSGDFFTQHATSDGLVITKYSLNHDPICLLEVVSPMPYVGSLPAAITFDASGSYDPDGDELNYHWDFNGDGIFDGVGDEYRGDPWNPTHEFNQYGIHDVMLKITDNYGGECYAVVQVTILEMN